MHRSSFLPFSLSNSRFFFLPAAAAAAAAAATLPRLPLFRTFAHVQRVLVPSNRGRFSIYPFESKAVAIRRKVARTTAENSPSIDLSSDNRGYCAGCRNPH